MATDAIANLANRINSMARTNYDDVGKELVERWYQRNVSNPNIPQSMLDDIQKVLDPRFVAPWP